MRYQGLMRAGLPVMLSAGTRLGSYEVIRLLGEGGMAHVCEARHVTLGKRVAVKVVRIGPGSTATPARLVREGRAISAVRHPHIVDVFEIGEEGGVPYLVMELLDGVDLAEHLRKRGKLTIAETADLVLPIVSALGAAHDVGVVHRDLKPSNVFLARAAGGVEAKLLDFGISKMKDVRDDLTATAAMLGTLHYMSPEQTRAAKNADARSDQYSVGVILFECVTGAKPFDGDSTYTLMHAIVTAPAPAPSTREPSVPAAFDEVVRRAMARDPRDRFASVYEMGVALLPFASERTAARWREELVERVAACAAEAPHSHRVRPPDSTLGGATVREESAPRRRSRAGWVLGGSAMVLAAAMAWLVSPRPAVGAAVASQPAISLTLGRDDEPRVEAPDDRAGAAPAASPRVFAQRAPTAVRPPPASSIAAAPAASFSLGRNDAPILD
jgi:serine/threonine-protein kinase